MNHFAGVAVDEFSKSIPRESTFSGGISVEIAKTRPGRLLGDSAQIIPNESFSVLRALVPRAIRAIREQQEKGTADKKISGAHGRLCFSSSQHPLMNAGNIRSSF